MFQVGSIEFKRGVFGGSVTEDVSAGPKTNFSNFVTHILPDVILMQYTGLKDKNGTEIYEGDIVKATKENIPLIVVFWDDFTASFNGTKDNYLHSEIIGNIYENPELLEPNS